MKPFDLKGIEESKRPVLFCSFGKDSSSVLHALTPWLDKVMVVFIDFGGIYPDVTDWAHKRGAELPHFFYIHPPDNLWGEIRSKGWPVDAGITDFTDEGAALAQDAETMQIRLRPWTDFYTQRLWLPAFVFTKMYGADCFISGERKKDRPYAADWAQRNNGAGESVRPIFEWSDADVWEYVDANGIYLPPSYQTRDPKRNDTYVSFGGHDLSPQNIVGMKEFWPEIYHKVFVEEGMAKSAKVIAEKLTELADKWNEICRIVGE